MTRRYGCPTCMNGYCAEHKEAQPTMSEAKDRIELFKDEDKAKDILKDVLRERVRQENKWGQQNHDGPLYVSILLEEVGEVAHAILEARFGSGDESEIRTELIQVAAVAVAMVEAFDRKKCR